MANKHIIGGDTIDSSNPLSVTLASGGGATTVADGADATQGAIADAVVAAGAAGTLSAKLRRLTTDVSALLGRFPAAAAASDADANAAATAIRVLLERWTGAAWQPERTPTVFKSINGMVMAAGTAQSIWQPASGKKFRLMGWQISGTAATLLIFKYGASAGASVAFLRTAVQAASVPNASPPNLGDGLLPGVADDQLWIDVNAATPTLNGFVFGTEE